jgi:hypothetical protein
MDGFGLEFTLAIAAGIALYFGVVVLIGKCLHSRAYVREPRPPAQPEPWDDWDFIDERRERDGRETRRAHDWQVKLEDELHRHGGGRS